MSDTCNTSKDDDLDLLRDDIEAFSGYQEEVEGAAENLFAYLNGENGPGGTPSHEAFSVSL